VDVSQLELQHTIQHDQVDILIVGGGPIGMFTAFYGGMRQANVRLIESMPQLGGQLIALYPEKYIYDVAGFPKITAQNLISQLKQQLDYFQPDIRLEERVTHVEKIAECRFAVTTNKTIHYAKAVIITAGIGAFEPRRLKLPEAKQYEQTNLYYFVRDAHQFQNQHVLISGGGDSAVDWALMLEPIAKQVTLVHRNNKFRAHEHSVKQLMNSNVEILTPHEITMLHGEAGRINHVTLAHTQSKNTDQLAVDAVIVNFGFLSSLGPIATWGITIEGGSIVVDSRMETSIRGLFAAGDITTYPGKIKLIATGFGEAPTAINNAKVYIDPTAKLSPGHSSSLNM